MNSVNGLISNSDLHCRPLSALLGKEVAYRAVWLRNIKSDSLFQRHLLATLSKSLLIVGEALLLPLALIEAAGGAAIAAVGICISTLICRNNAPFYQRKFLKIAAYALHGSFVFLAALSVLAWYKQPDLKYHTQYTLLDQGFYLASGALVQQAWGNLRGASEEANSRILNLFKENYPTLFEQASQQIKKDVEIDIRETVDPHMSLKTYLERHPEEREFVRNFNVWKALNDAEYGLRAKQLLKNFLVEMGIGHSPEDSLSIHLSRITDEEAAYQRKLIGLVHCSFTSIYVFPPNFKCLDREGKSGQERLKELDAGVFTPLARYAQSTELLQAIGCPPLFTTLNLAPYSSRRSELFRLKSRVGSFEPSRIKILQDKLLYGNRVAIETPHLTQIQRQEIQEIAAAIRRLANDLQRGALMQQVVIDLENIDSVQAFQTRNLFEKACREQSALIRSASNQIV